MANFKINGNINSTGTISSPIGNFDNTKMDLLYAGTLFGGGESATLANGNQYDFLIIKFYTDGGTNNGYGLISCKDQDNIYGGAVCHAANGARLWTRYQFEPNLNRFTHNNIGFDSTTKNHTSGWCISRIWGIKLK